ncbi:unnamed protein product [Discosporangium mesarthrocarpum]
MNIAKNLLEASSALESWGVRVLAVDMDTERRLGKDVGLQRVPVIKVYHGEGTPNPYGGMPIRSSQDVFTMSDFRSMQKDILNAIPNLVTPMDIAEGSVENGSSVQGLVSVLSGKEGSTSLAVFVTDTKKPSPLIRALASELGKERLEFVHVRLSLNKVGDQAGEEDRAGAATRILSKVWELPGGLPRLPGLVVLDRTTRKGKAFEGNMKEKKDIVDFVLETSGLASTTQEQPQPLGANGEDGGGEEPNRTVTEPPGVISLDPSRLASIKEEGREALVVAFFRGEGSEDLDGGLEGVFPGWEKATKGLQGQIRAASVNCSLHPSLCTGAVAERPLIQVYPHDHDDGDFWWANPSSFPVDQVEKAVKEAENSLPQLVLEVPSGLPPQQAQAAFESYLNTLFSQGREGSMVMAVLSNRKHPNLLVKTVAAEFEDSDVAVIFMSQPGQEMVSRMGLRKLPAIMIMARPPVETREELSRNSPNGNREEQLVTAVFSSNMFGPLGHVSVRNFVLRQMMEANPTGFVSKARQLTSAAKVHGHNLGTGLEEMVARIEEKVKLKESGGSNPGINTASSPSLHSTWGGMLEEATAENFYRLCSSNSAHLCAIFALDRLAPGHSKALEAATEAAEKAATGHGGSSLSFSWLDAPCQSSFVQMMGLGDASALPGLVVYSPRRLLMSRFLGAWEAGAMAKFLRGVLTGQYSTQPLSDLPSLEEEMLDCLSRQLPGSGEQDEGAQGSLNEAETAAEEEMEAFMEEIWAEEVRVELKALDRTLEPQCILCSQYWLWGGILWIDFATYPFRSPVLPMIVVLIAVLPPM